MLAIYKYRITKYEEIVDAPIINWLYVDWQERESCYCIWGMVDDEAANRKFKVKLVETGEHFSNTELNGFSYLGTVNKNLYVAHFFVAELDPKTYEVMVDDEEQKEEEIKPISLDWFLAHPDSWRDLIPEGFTADWTYRPEQEVRF